MELDIVGLVGACSYALDCIEAELVHVTNRHGKRVAYISVCMAERLGIEGSALQDLAICAMLHDNALTQYISEEIQENNISNISLGGSTQGDKNTVVEGGGMFNESEDIISENGMAYSPEIIKSIVGSIHKKIGLHCTYGEQNIKKLPFYTDVSGAVLYHHENADGTGTFGKRWDEIPLFARIIHLCDMVDVMGNSCDFSGESWIRAKEYVCRNRNILFDSECADAFLEVFSEENFVSMSQDRFEDELWKRYQGTRETVILRPVRVSQIFLPGLSIISRSLRESIRSVWPRRRQSWQNTWDIHRLILKNSIWQVLFMTLERWL